LYRYIWGLQDIKNEYTKISKFKAPLVYDPVKMDYIKKENPSTKWKIIGMISMLLLIGGMIITTIFLLSLKQY